MAKSVLLAYDYFHGLSANERAVIMNISPSVDCGGVISLYFNGLGIGLGLIS
ncbi:hypothetical protein ACSV5M_00050 [Cellvibrio sp. ARAG 10.3]|uniref:hypothetical protein n=1 Tax=Cellvibrio sp. ARAG 10.3 TaxID=3451358 RepID=UPI003F486DA5